MLYQYPPPPGPIEAPGSVEQVFLFCLAYLLLLSLGLLALPQRLTQRIIQIAFRLRRDSMDGGVR